MSSGHKYEHLPWDTNANLNDNYSDDTIFEQGLTSGALHAHPWPNSNTLVDQTNRIPDQISVSHTHRKPVPSLQVSYTQLKPGPQAISTHIDPTISKPPNDGNQGQPLDRFLLRAVLSIFIPLTLVSYYTLTYLRWLRYPEESGEAWVVRGYLDNAELVNYSWFVLATFGLNLGTYCISGSVASMTMAKWWSPANSRILLELAANSFADPSNWIKSIFLMIKKRTFLGQNNGRLWNMLTFLNMIGFIAWPLTGLTMQTVDGFAIDFKNGPTGGNVLGRNETSFNQRSGQDFLDRETNGRTSGIAGQLPRGQLYTEAGSRAPLNVTTRNMMPDDATTPIFLTSQADYPFVANRVFGLLVSYNCTVVKSADEFTILNQRRNLSDIMNTNPLGNVVLDSTDKENNAIATLLRRNMTRLSQPYVNATMEVGTSIPWINFTQTNRFTYPAYSAIDEFPGINKPVLLEVALWQAIPENRVLGYQGYVNVTIRGVEKNELQDLRGIYPNQTAVGCRCFASSDVGFADVDGITASYSNFTSADPRLRGGDLSSTYITPLRFEHGVANRVVSAKYWTINGIPISMAYGPGTPLFTDWYYNLLTSTGFYWRELRNTDRGDEYLSSVIQADDLRSTLLRIHHSYALQLMYDGTVDTSLSWSNPNITLATPGKVLVRGVVPPEVILAMLASWTLGIVTLAVIYQFRRRWTQKLNTFNMFILGLNVNDSVGIEPEDLVRGNKKNLEKLPGTIGDLNAGGSVGVIGLTRGVGTVARRNKPY
ncbi:hypothetical protein TWF569_007547 [Orbilia oligospora]|uniref:Uncharacterized protein n=1 Tax=Orbilia oligospora TaxID=2813651 RepID=A0A7C8JIJ2_ORBOL|nr:hypothetical protein TWF103_005892 [Orbilia oligospora]KAF3111346.1 hypothetical protein TWF102_007019 [Orbilia oligospora]KAF3114287.1 hypothetical protein TWF706_008223 [Orbilia oligospora]KAF3142692.1 hypothetical protein TWF569_007547 [Orbilia oligospora]